VRNLYRIMSEQPIHGYNPKAYVAHGIDGPDTGYIQKQIFYHVFIMLLLYLEMPERA